MVHYVLSDLLTVGRKKKKEAAKFFAGADDAKESCQRRKELQTSMFPTVHKAKKVFAKTSPPIQTGF